MKLPVGKPDNARQRQSHYEEYPDACNTGSASPGATARLSGAPRFRRTGLGRLDSKIRQFHKMVPYRVVPCRQNAGDPAHSRS